MTTKHYADAEGNYIGGFGDGALPPSDAIETPAPPGAQHKWTGAAWVIDPATAIASERARMVCSPMQGMLALGEIEWAKVQAYRDNEATFAEKVIIDRAGDWRRNSQNIAFFQHLLDYTPEQVDDLFRAAMEIVA